MTAGLFGNAKHFRNESIGVSGASGVMRYALIVLVTGAIALLAASPAQAGHKVSTGLVPVQNLNSSNSAGYSIAQLGHKKNRHRKHQNREYEKGFDIGEEDGYDDGYQDGRRGRRYCGQIGMCFDDYSPYFEDGYLDAYPDAYRAGFRKGRRDRRYSRRWRWRICW